MSRIALDQEAAGLMAGARLVPGHDHPAFDEDRDGSAARLSRSRRAGGLSPVFGNALRSVRPPRR